MKGTKKSAEKPEAWRIRLLNERKDLSEKIGKLATFISSQEYDKLDDGDKDLLCQQRNVMLAYQRILNMRIKGMPKEITT